MDEIPGPGVDKRPAIPLGLGPALPGEPRRLQDLRDRRGARDARGTQALPHSRRAQVGPGSKLEEAQVGSDPGAPRLERVLAGSVYDFTTLKLRFGHLTLKLYDKGARVRRIEVIVHGVKALRCGRRVKRRAIMLARLQRMVIDFLNVVYAAHRGTLDADALDALCPSRRSAEPSGWPAWTSRSHACGPCWRRCWRSRPARRGSRSKT